MSKRRRGGIRAWLWRLWVLVAVAYPLALLALMLALRFIGESWWVTSVGLYLPRVPFVAPLVLLALVTAIVGPRRLLWLDVGIGLLAVFWFLDFVAPNPLMRSASGPRLRVLSWNVDGGFAGYGEISRKIVTLSPDVAVLQEILLDPKEFVADLRRSYPYVQLSTQFLIASRFPIVETSNPERIEFKTRDRSPRFVRYLIDTPLGKIAFYNVHPLSPRGGFYALRGKGLRHEILSGNLFSGGNAGEFVAHTELRVLQLQAASERAEHEQLPVVIAGDLNSPSLSPAFERYLGKYQDGFEEAGWGLGYTFPHHPRRPLWMRLDRILASASVRFSSFAVCDDSPSDHLCVTAELTTHQ